MTQTAPTSSSVDPYRVPTTSDAVKARNTVALQKRKESLAHHSGLKDAHIRDNTISFDEKPSDSGRIHTSLGEFVDVALIAHSSPSMPQGSGGATHTTGVPIRTTPHVARTFSCARCQQHVVVALRDSHNQHCRLVHRTLSSLLLFKMTQTSGVEMCVAPSTDMCWGQNTSRIQNKEVYTPFHL